jgi:hypothetical protein
MKDRQAGFGGGGGVSIFDHIARHAERSKTALVNASLAGKPSGAGGAMADLKAIFGLDEDDDADSEED